MQGIIKQEADPGMHGHDNSAAIAQQPPVQQPSRWTVVEDEPAPQVPISRWLREEAEAAAAAKAEQADERVRLLQAQLAALDQAATAAGGGGGGGGEQGECLQRYANLRTIVYGFYDCVFVVS